MNQHQKIEALAQWIGWQARLHPHRKNELWWHDEHGPTVRVGYWNPFTRTASAYAVFQHWQAKKVLQKLSDEESRVVESREYHDLAEKFRKFGQRDGGPTIIDAAAISEFTGKTVGLWE
jgi:hypothetical protein